MEPPAPTRAALLRVVPAAVLPRRARRTPTICCRDAAVARKAAKGPKATVPLVFEAVANERTGHAGVGYGVGYGTGYGVGIATHSVEPSPFSNALPNGACLAQSQPSTILEPPAPTTRAVHCCALYPLLCFPDGHAVHRPSAVVMLPSLITLP